MAQFRCKVCSFVHQGRKPPGHCPICGVGSRQFEEVEDKKEDAGKDKDRDRNLKQ